MLSGYAASSHSAAAAHIRFYRHDGRFGFSVVSTLTPRGSETNGRSVTRSERSILPAAHPPSTSLLTGRQAAGIRQSPAAVRYLGDVSER